MKSLLKEYRESLEDLLCQKEAAEEYDQKVYISMIRDMRYVIYLLENGYPPGYRKGIHKKSQSLYYDKEFSLYIPKDIYKNDFDLVCDRIDHEREKEIS